MKLDIAGSINKMEKKTSDKREKFNEKFKYFSDTGLLKEQIYNQKSIHRMLDRIRSNTSTLIWFLIIITIIVALLQLS